MRCIQRSMCFNGLPQAAGGHWMLALCASRAFHEVKDTLCECSALENCMICMRICFMHLKVMP